MNSIEFGILSIALNRQRNAIHSISSRRTSIPLPTSLSLQILLLHRLTPLQRRKLKLIHSALQALPPAITIAIRPHQRTNPRLHIPMQTQRRIRPLRNPPTHVRDLIFGFLIAELHDAGASAVGVGFADSFAGFRFGFWGRFRGGVDVGVGVPGCVVGGNDGVPDDGFRLWDCRVVGGVRGGDVHEDLFGVPVEEGGEVWGC